MVTGTLPACLVAQPPPPSFVVVVELRISVVGIAATCLCWLVWCAGQAVCTEAGMFALRERRIHVTQEDFDMAVAKVMKKDSEKDMSVIKLFK